MLFPNFDVSSLGVKMGALVKGTRMSLSHLDGRQQDLQGFCQPLAQIIPARRRLFRPEPFRAAAIQGTDFRIPAAD
jgi:hypothetical protein